MSEPDRYDKRVGELARHVEELIFDGDEECGSRLRWSLRRMAEEVEAEALERAAQVAYGFGACNSGDAIRALIPPAAAPAAETKVCVCRYLDGAEFMGKCPAHPAPPSEPAAPAPDRCPFEEKDCLEARVLLHQCAKALRGVLAHAEWLDKHLGRLPNTDEENARTVLAKLAARTSPGAAGEGKT